MSIIFANFKDIILHKNGGNMDKMIGERIRTRRKELNITQMEIQKELGISSGNLSGIENGRVYPSASALIGLSKILQCTTDWILKGNSLNIENCSFSQNEDFLLKGFRTLSIEDQDEMLAILQIKMEKGKTVKGEAKEMVKSSKSMTSEECATIEKMA